MHHANLIIGNAEWGVAQIRACDREVCSDVILINLEKMSVIDARSLIYEATLRPIEREYRSFVIQTRQILHEAQNTLLKLFEEPNEHTIFYLIIPREDILLPTLRSRLMLLAKEDSNEEHVSFKEFLGMNYATRLDTIASKLKEEDTAWIGHIVEGFSIHAHTSRNKAYLEDALLLEKYIYTNGASKKMLLEHIAITLKNT